MMQVAIVFSYHLHDLVIMYIKKRSLLGFQQQQRLQISAIFADFGALFFSATELSYQDLIFIKIVSVN